jgi:CheY-like chemotaxis protein
MTPLHLTVLVVDDDSAIRQCLVDLLTDEGYDVRAACEGAEAFDSMGICRPDVIILDLRMPVMDGWTFRRRQRELIDYKTIPTIIMSAADRPEDAALGAACFVRKPFSPVAMLAAVSAAAPHADR